MKQQQEQRRVVFTDPASVEQVICSTRGTGLFLAMMKLALGLNMWADNILMTLVSYLGPCVAADWGLSSAQQGFLTASVFAGNLAGAAIFGIMSDHYGRRPTFKIATGLVFTFGLLTAVAPSLWWLMFFRFMVGVGAGAVEVPFDLLIEIVPIKEKGRIVVEVALGWAIGSLSTAVIAWAVLESGYSWRWLALLAAMPTVAVVCCFAFVPESPRWYLVNGRPNEAKDTLKAIAKRNGIELGDFTLRREEHVASKNTGIGDLWRRPELRKLTLVSCTVWAMFNFLYYGILLFSAEVLGETDTCSFDYSILVFAASSELVSNLVAAMYIDAVDHRNSLTLNFVLSGLATLFLSFNYNVTWLFLLAFVARGGAYMADCFAWVITPELYPTEIRSTGHAVSNSMSIIASMAVSYWVTSGLSYNIVGAVIMAAALTGGVAVQFLTTIRYKEAAEGYVEGSERTPLLSDGVKVVVYDGLRMSSPPPCHAMSTSGLAETI